MAAAAMGANVHHGNPKWQRLPKRNMSRVDKRKFFIIIVDDFDYLLW